MVCVREMVCFSDFLCEVKGLADSAVKKDWDT